MTRFTVRALVALLAAVPTGLLLGPATTPAAAVASYPSPTPGLSPVGANDWACEPTAARPYPAVIVHGTFGDKQSLLNTLSSSLKRAGYCVYSLDYGNRGTGPVEDSAGQLDRFVDTVLGASGAAKVEIVGHSQGGMMPRYYIKNLGGASKVEDLVGLSPSNHGTGSHGGFDPGSFCVACTQQAAGSDFLTALNNPDETPGLVDYTQVTTTHDEVVVPYTSGFLEAGPRSTNLVLQARCPAYPVEHLSIPTNPQAIGWVLNAFDRDGPADPKAPVGCL